MYKKYNQNFSWMRYSGIFVCSIALIFVFIALSSYYPFDRSLFYASNDLFPLHNRAGSAGALCAALLFYLFGGAAFCCVVPLFFTLLFLVKRWHFKNEWERFFACFYGICISAAVLATAMIDVSWSPYPGGIGGMVCAQQLLMYGDPIGRMLFLITSMAACFFLLFRFSFMFLVEWCMKAGVYSIAVMRRYQVVRRIAHATVLGFYYCIVYPICNVFFFILSLIDGSAFNDTDLVVGYQEDDSDDIFLLDVIEEKSMHDCVLSDPDIVAGDTVAYTASVRGADDYEEQSQPIQNNNNNNNDNDDAKKFDDDYALPHPDIFIAEKSVHEDHDLEKELEARAHVLEDKLKRFGVTGMVTAIKRGPVVTLFEYQPDVDTKISKIIALEDDLAMALQAM